MDRSLLSYGLSGKNLQIADIFKQYTDVSASLRLYFSAASPDYAVIFASETHDTVEKLYRDRLKEADLNHTLSVLASLEASFRVDYVLRCKLKRKDRVSREFRLIYKRKKERVRLEQDILDIWKKNTTVPPRVIGDMIGAFNLRHWLAHGRWWDPMLGQTYDFFSVYTIATEVLNSFGLEGVWAD